VIDFTLLEWRSRHGEDGMFYRIMMAPPGYAPHQRYMVAAYRTLELPATGSVGLNNADGSPFFSSLEEARRVIPANAKKLPFEPRWQFFELWEASDSADCTSS
jgi:hypothetical protein